MEASFSEVFWPSLTSGILAGLVVAGVAYVFINKWLGLRDRHKDDERTRAVILATVLRRASP
jgi:hypothetical protein